MFLIVFALHCARIVRWYCTKAELIEMQYFAGCVVNHAYIPVFSVGSKWAYCIIAVFANDRCTSTVFGVLPAEKRTAGYSVYFALRIAAQLQRTCKPYLESRRVQRSWHKSGLLDASHDELNQCCGWEQEPPDIADHPVTHGINRAVEGHTPTEKASGASSGSVANGTLLYMRQ